MHAPNYFFRNWCKWRKWYMGGAGGATNLSTWVCVPVQTITWYEDPIVVFLPFSVEVVKIFTSGRFSDLYGLNPHIQKEMRSGSSFQLWSVWCDSRGWVLTKDRMASLLKSDDYSFILKLKDSEIPSPEEVFLHDSIKKKTRLAWTLTL